MAMGEPAHEARSAVTAADRDAAIAALREAAGDGLIDLDDFGDRAGAVYGASLVEELQTVLADLPAPALPVVAPVDPSPVGAPPSVQPQWVVAVMGGAQRRGTWRAEQRVNAVAVMAGCTLDFRHAELSGPVTYVHAMAIMGGVEIIVPEGVPVEVDGFVLMGGLEDKTRPKSAPGSPMLRVKGNGMWGAVIVRHPRPEERRLEAGSSDPAPVEAARSTLLNDARGSTVTMLFTDLIDSTSKADALGDQRWLDVLRGHNRMLREHFERCGGREIKAQGDGFMVSFPSARQALLCAIEIQRDLAAHRIHDPDGDLHVRIGVHSGEVVADEDDLFGRNVIAASRIAGEAGADQILTSALTKALTDSGSDLAFGEARSIELRGLSGPWVVHEVRW